MTSRFCLSTACLALGLLCGCNRQPPGAPPPSDPAPGTTAREDASSSGDADYDYYGSYYGAGEITFVDDVATNVAVGDEITSLTFTDIDGAETRLADYAGKKTVVLVITRGNTNPICPYCTTQTSRLITNYQKFADRNAEVLVVYPIEHSGDAERLNAFLEASRKLLASPQQTVPFPVLLDVELKAVDQLGIRKDLSKPATYIIDPQGHVRFAYVGADISDRPSIDALIKQLDAAAGATEPATGESE